MRQVFYEDKMTAWLHIGLCRFKVDLKLCNYNAFITE